MEPIEFGMPAVPLRVGAAAASDDDDDDDDDDDGLIPPSISVYEAMSLEPSMNEDRKSKKKDAEGVLFKNGS